MKKTTIYILAAFFTITTSWACFMTLSLEQMVQRSEVIVKGKIVRIEYPANKDATRKTTRIKTGENTYSVTTESTGVILHDTAYILIEQILKAPKEKEIRVGDRIPFSMPSKHNMTMSSTDIRYSEGEEGVWFLSIHNEKYRAGHPMSHQKSQKLGDIQSILKKQ